MSRGIVCPWCDDDGFDLEGLKQHLTLGGLSYGPCEKFVECGKPSAPEGARGGK